MKRRSHSSDADRPEAHPGGRDARSSRGHGTRDPAAAAPGAANLADREALDAPVQRRLFQIELPLPPGWEAIEPFRAAVLACVKAVFPNPALAPSIGLVTAELLENAVKFGRWDEGGGMFALRMDGDSEHVAIEVSSPVADGDENLERLREELARIQAAPSPEQAYTKALRAVALGKPACLGLCRVAYEGGCDVSAEIDANVLRVRAVTRRLEPARPTPAAPA